MDTSYREDLLAGEKTCWIFIQTTLR